MLLIIFIALLGGLVLQYLMKSSVKSFGCSRRAYNFRLCEASSRRTCSVSALVLTSGSLVFNLNPCYRQLSDACGRLLAEHWARFASRCRIGCH